MSKRYSPNTEQEALIALLQLPGVGSSLATRLKRAMGSARAVFAASSEELLSIRGIGIQLAERIVAGPDQETLARAMVILERSDSETLLVDRAGYPRQMQRLKAPPAVLYLRGAKVWRGARCVGIVGTRSPDQRGLLLTREVTRQLVEAGFVIVSGGAAGIDTCAHSLALQRGAPTIAVLGSGFRHPYPAGNRPLFEEIAAKGGALLTEFGPDVKPERGHFPRRNRLICGLCDAIVVTQCGRKSGALHTATLARRLGIPVFAFPGLPNDPLSAGPHRLIREGATLVESGREIAAILESRPSAPEQLSLFGAPSPAKADNVRTEPPLRLSSEQRQAWDALGHAPLHVDDVAAKAGLPIQVCVTTLLEMELDGVVQVHEGMRYSRVEGGTHV